MADYGTNGYAEDSSAWSQYQVYEVAYGLAGAIPFPEIYVSANATQWDATFNAYQMTFWCPTSANGSGGYLSWQSSWNDLATAVGSSYVDTCVNVI